MPPTFNPSAYDYAHRGLWSEGIPENSFEAFRRAVAEGFGIECDVHLSRDGVPMVFHDFTLDRLTGLSGQISDMNANDLQTLKLAGSEETIPRLSDLLDVMEHQPLLVEIKCNEHTDRTALVSAVCGALAFHAGPVAIMSFDRETLRLARACSEELILGVLTPPMYYEHDGASEDLIAFSKQIKPTYLAPNVADMPFAAPIANAMNNLRKA